MSEKEKSSANASDFEENEVNTEQEVNNQEEVENQTEAQKEEEQDSLEEASEPKVVEVNVDFKDKYYRLSAEFDNYRKRTLKEKMDLTKTAGESIILKLLPVMDDFDRGLESIEQATEVDGVKEGVQLIHTKLLEFLSQNGVKEVEAKEAEFDVDIHEAVTKIPAPSDNLKGKVVDVIQKGYQLNDKVIRFPKVVVGE